MVFSAVYFSIVVILFHEFCLSVAGFRLRIQFYLYICSWCFGFWCFSFDMLKRFLVFLGFGRKFHLFTIFAMTGLWWTLLLSKRMLLSQRCSCWCYFLPECNLRGFGFFSSCVCFWVDLVDIWGWWLPCC